MHLSKACFLFSAQLLGDLFGFADERALLEAQLLLRFLYFSGNCG